MTQARPLRLALGIAALALSTSAAGGTVSIDVVVTDANARPVQNLQPADFELIDVGEPRAVDTVRPRPDGPRVFGIFLDEFHVRAGDASERARTALSRFVDTELRDGDMVAIAKGTA